MLNIISKTYVEGETNGPNKVVTNLIKGLNILGYPYCINKDFGATAQLWVHDDGEAVAQLSKDKIHAVVGPNIYILPRNIPENTDLSKLVYIQPSKWARDFWNDCRFSKCPLDVWPAAIDTNEFPERTKPLNGKVLLYYKQRYVEELDFVKKILENNKISYQIVTYGSYNEAEYKNILKNTKYVIWLGRHETQGIALQEALAMNVPMLVWDVESLGHWNPRKKDINIYTKEELSYKNTTSAEYFDERCGIKTKNRAEIEYSVEEMEQKWETFNPREYILENLGLEKQAMELLSLFDKYFDIKYEDGKKEVIKNNKKWRNDRVSFKLFSFTKALAKKIVGKKG